MFDGWILLHRILLNKPIWKNSSPGQKSILITLLLMASHNENEWEWKGEKFKVNPGQFITSLDSIKEYCGKGIGIQNIRTALVRFKKLKFLTDESTNKGRLITICNWESYQKIKNLSNKATNMQLTSTSQAPNKHLTPINNVNNENKVKNNKEEIIKEEKSQFLEFVFLTDNEYKKLNKLFGENKTNEWIERLNDYANQIGKQKFNSKYKSHYHTILNWDRLEKKKNEPKYSQKRYGENSIKTGEIAKGRTIEDI